jgi:predicted HTH transcriptional regulator
MREEGEGVARMFEEMETSYLNAPEFAVEASTLTVTLRNEPIFAGVDPAWYGAVRKLPLSLPQRRLLVAHPTTFSNEDLRKLSGLDRDEAYQEIQHLVGMGFVSSPPSAGRGAIYRVLREEVERAAQGNATNAIAKRAIPIAHSGSATAWVAERVQALATYLLDHETLTNADYRALFMLERDAALRELKHLSRVGWLVAEGSGRGSRYRRGPLFLPTEGAP